MLPGCNCPAGTPMGVQGSGLAPGTGWEGGRFLCALQAVCVTPAEDFCILQGPEKQSKKFTARKQTQIYQPSSRITCVARNKALEGKKYQENKPRSSLSPPLTGAPGCCWLGFQEISKNSWRDLNHLSQSSLTVTEQPLAQEVLNSPQALWMSL